MRWEKPEFPMNEIHLRNFILKDKDAAPDVCVTKLRNVDTFSI